MIKMSETNSHDSPETPQLQELDRRTYDSLVRTATMFATSQGEPLLIGAKNSFSLSGDKILNTYHTFSADGQPVHNLMGEIDAKALLVDPRKLVSMPQNEVGSVVGREITGEDLPFETEYEKLQIQVGIFSESIIPVVKERLNSVTDLTALPVCVVQLDFMKDSTDPDTGETYLFDQQWMQYVILPPERDGVVSKAVRIRDYGQWTDIMPEPSSDAYKAFDVLTAKTYAKLLEHADYDYNFSQAAQNKIITDRHVAMGGDPYDLEFFGSPYEGYIDGESLEGNVDKEGVEMLQRLIEIAMHDGKPIEHDT